jgi:hypothetical protein
MLEAESGRWRLTMPVMDFRPNTLPRIGSLWAYLSKDDDGNEGVCAAPIEPGGACLPLIAADQERLKSITPIAEQIARLSGMTIILVEFTTRTELREITGHSNG